MMYWIWVCLGLAVLLGAFRFFRKTIFARFLSSMCAKNNKMLKDQKRAMFQVINERAKEQGPSYKVLELGGGSGSNFEFITEPVNWIVTEPNQEFAKFFQANVAKNGGSHHISELVEARAEDLSAFDKASVDAVVVSLVLCSVQDMQRVLNEVQRVLKPGGHFVFVEHVIDKANSPRQILQSVLSRSKIWPFLFDGCMLNRDSGKMVKDQPGFAKVELTTFRMPGPFFPFAFLRAGVYGVATR